MPKVKGGLFSETVSGSIAGILTFQKSTAGLQVHSKIQRQRKRSYHQILLSAEWGDAIADWRILADNLKQEFIDKAKGKAVTPFNLSQQDYLYYLRGNYYGVAIYNHSVYNATD